MNKELTKEQYEAAHTILGFCRIFTDQMVKCMKNSGLDKMGYHLNISFDPVTYENSQVSIGRVGLEKEITVDGGTEWWTSAFIQRHIVDEGWVIGHDPYAEIGTLPEDIRYPEERIVSKRMAEKTEHPYPPDGFWVGTDYCDPVLGGGM